MVTLYKIIGYIGIIGGVFIAILSPIFSINKPDTYIIAGGIAAIIYGIIALVKASFFERLETDVKQTRTNTVLLYKYLKGEYTEQGPNDPAPVQSEQPAQDQNFSSWKRKE